MRKPAQTDHRLHRRTSDLQDSLPWPQDKRTAL